MKNRLREIRAEHVRTAFREAHNHGAALLSVTNHDWRDMSAGIERVWEMLSTADAAFDDVRFEYVSAVEGMRKTLGIEDIRPPGLDVWFESKAGDDVLRVTAEHELFGPQPFLALKTRSGQYHWENFDFEGDDGWSYTFDFNTLELDAIREVGVASNSPAGAWGIEECWTGPTSPRRPVTDGRRNCTPGRNWTNTEHHTTPTRSGERSHVRTTSHLPRRAGPVKQIHAKPTRKRAR
ncbi:hypothetical protein BRC64_05885 [Halobacteriales archaeon QH_10_67_22]|nr:MAG: hypothetical protein BRC64_05885 [Halobacteriales archaeon QH_10_67_22]